MYRSRNNQGSRHVQWRGNGFHSQQLIIPKSVCDAQCQIDEVLKRWGFIVNRKTDERNFVRSIKDATADCFDRKLLKEWNPINTSVSLPTDLEVALRLLLNHTIKQVTKDGAKLTVIKTTDALSEKYGVNMPFPPYNPVRGEYKLTRAYRNLNVPEELLHPFERFSYHERSIGAYLFDEFSTKPEEECPSHFVRPLCIHAAVHGNNVKCVGCNAEGSLLFNSSLRTDFCHLVCDDCGSVYTLSCVANKEKVQQLFDKKSQFRGSYAHYHEVEHLLADGPRSKMYFAFATRSNPDGCSHELPVYVAEIKGAAPNLNTDSFVKDRIRIKSNVVFEPLLGRRPWFTVLVPQDIDVHELSMEVFSDHFDVESLTAGSSSSPNLDCAADRFSRLKINGSS